MKKYLLMLSIILLVSAAYAESKKVKVDRSGIDSILKWFNSGGKQKQLKDLENQKGNQIVQMIFDVSCEDSEKGTTLIEELKSLKSSDSKGRDLFLVKKAELNREGIEKFLDSISKQDITGVSYGRAMAVMPESFRAETGFDLFLVCCGWHWGDAMAFQYETDGDTYKLSRNGRRAILFNLTKVYTEYGDTDKEKMKTLEDVMAHEIFHTLLDEFGKKKGWKFCRMEDKFRYTLMNEGVAHYIAMRKRLHSDYDKYKEREKTAFSTLKEKYRVISNSKLEKSVRIKTLFKGTYGRFWSKYLCISGMFMAYHIEQYRGFKGLRDAIDGGGESFLSTYRALVKEKNLETFL